MTSPTEDRRTRIAVNLDPATLAMLRELTRRNQETTTQTVRRAIRLAKFIADEMAAGHRVQVTDGRNTRDILLIY